MREAEGYREALEFLTDLFPGKAAIGIKDCCVALDRDRRTLLADKNFPAKQVGNRYTIAIPELARWMVRR